METDWEKKDMRIGWMNINSSCANILAARITAGLFKPKNNQEAMKELLDMISVEFSEFQTVGVVKPSLPTSGSTGKFYCTHCQKEITEKVKDFSERKFLTALCMECQKEL